MNLTSLRHAALAIVAAASIACAGNTGEPTGPSSSDDEAPVAEAKGGVAGQLEFFNDKASAHGAFSYEGGRAELGIETVGENVYDIFVDVNGSHLTMIVDQSGGVVEMDGYAASNGQTTFMSAADREVLLGVFGALDKLGTEGVPNHVTLLRRMVGHWAENSSTLTLQRQKLFDAKKTITSLCGYCWQYVKFTHDCWGTDKYDDKTTQYGLVAHIGSYSGCANGTKYRTSDGVWHCLANEPDHSTGYEYQKGNCYGRCGPGCSSEKDYTLDCGNHDQCVRNGHATASMWCDDEFTSCTDDEASAPSCGACD